MDAAWVQIILIIGSQLIIVGGGIITITSKLAMLTAEVKALKETVMRHDSNFVPRAEWEGTLNALRDRIASLEGKRA